MGSSLSKSHLPRNYWTGETGQVIATSETIVNALQTDEMTFMTDSFIDSSCGDQEQRVLSESPMSATTSLEPRCQLSTKISGGNIPPT